MSRSTFPSTDRIRASIDALPEPARTVFRLHAGEGVAYVEIACRLDLDIVAVEQLLAEAIIALGCDLGADDG